MARTTAPVTYPNTPSTARPVRPGPPNPRSTHIHTSNGFPTAPATVRPWVPGKSTPNTRPLTYTMYTQTGPAGETMVLFAAPAGTSLMVTRSVVAFMLTAMVTGVPWGAWYAAQTVAKL